MGLLFWILGLLSFPFTSVWASGDSPNEINFAMRWRSKSRWWAAEEVFRVLDSFEIDPNDSDRLVFFGAGISTCCRETPKSLKTRSQFGALCRKRDSCKFEAAGVEIAGTETGIGL